MNYLPCLPCRPCLLPNLPCSSSSPQGRHHQHLPHPQHRCHPRPSTCQSRPTSSRYWKADQLPSKPSANAAWSSQQEASPSMGLPPPSQGQTRCTWASLGTWSPQDPPKRKVKNSVLFPPLTSFRNFMFSSKAALSAPPLPLKNRESFSTYDQNIITLDSSDINLWPPWFLGSRRLTHWSWGRWSLASEPTRH